MLNLLHISDLHFGKPFLEDVAEVLLDKIAALQADTDIIVVSGDFTQRAKPREYRQARAFLQRLPKLPRVLVPGNHDVPLYRVWERLLSPHALYREYISGELDTVLEYKHAVLVGLNTSDPYRAISNGRIRPEQLRLCEQTFAAAPDDKARIVVIHHHLVPTPAFERDRPLANAQRALETFTRLRVDLILAGHLHRAYVGNSLDVYSGKDRDHGIIVVQCGTSTSRRGRGGEREKNTFNWVQLDADTVRVTHFMYFADHQNFAPISRHRFARAHHGFLRQP